MKDETRFAKRVDAKLAKIPKSYWFTIQQTTICGDPDRIGVVNGIFVALELKRSRSAKRSELQTYKLAKINDAGGVGRFLYPENFDDILEELHRI